MACNASQLDASSIYMNIIHKDGFWSVIHLHKYCVAAPGRNAKAESHLMFVTTITTAGCVKKISQV